MAIALHDVFLEALQSDFPLASIEALVRDHPELPEAIGKAWAGGFSTEHIRPDVARLLIAHGAPLSIHAAGAFGFTDRVADLLRADPSLIRACGGDGCTPLHFARDVATAELLVGYGADVNALDEDHESSPAQWRIGKAPEVSRYLLDHGAVPDIFLAVALGDGELVARLVAEDPACVAQRIGQLPEFPPIGHKGRGGTILQWTLAFNSYPHQVALLKGHQSLFEFLYAKSDARTRLLVCCVLGRREEAEAIAREHSEIVPGLPVADLELLPRYCWETNVNYDAVRLMLDLGFPVAQTENSHGYSPLHNAAWCGHAGLVDLLISRGHPVDLVDPGYKATPLGWAIHDCVVAKRHPEGDFARVVESLLRAGSPWSPSMVPTGDERLDEVFDRFRSDSSAPGFREGRE